MNAKKSILVHDDSFYAKKEGNPLFDVSIGSYNESEIADLVG